MAQRISHTWGREGAGRVLVLVLAVAVGISACYGWSDPEPLAPDQFRATGALDPERQRIVGVTTIEGNRVDFAYTPGSPADEAGSAISFIRNDSLVGALGDDYSAFAFTDIERVWVSWRDIDAGKTVLAVVGIPAGVLLGAVAIAAALKESCPFIYSWDGEKWVFDAEPYGGATTRGLERDDFSELENLVAVNGEYRLRITNEVNETQYTNFLELWSVHHPHGTRMVSDEFGTLYAVRDPVPISAAWDAEGRDLRPWLQSPDHRIWEHPAEPTASGDFRQEIVLTFPRPEGAREGRLIARVATGIWGSHMIRELYEMRGTGVDAFFAEVDGSEEARQELLSWNLREELYALQIQVEEASGWEVRGILPGGGPFISEDRVVPIDLSRVEGDEVRIRIRPPVGFWGLDAFEMDFGPTEAFEVRSTALSHARTSEGEDVLASLSTVDDDYYAMPVPGDWAELRFPAVEPPAGVQQTFFLSSRGYYRLHLQADRTPDQAAIDDVVDVPGTTVRLAAAKFEEARRRVASAGGGTRR